MGLKKNIEKFLLSRVVFLSPQFHQISKVQPKKITQFPISRDQKMSYSKPKMVSSVKGNDPWDASSNQKSERVTIIDKNENMEKKNNKKAEKSKKTEKPKAKKAKKSNKKEVKKNEKKVEKKAEKKPEKVKKEKKLVEKKEEKPKRKEKKV